MRAAADDLPLSPVDAENNLFVTARAIYHNTSYQASSMSTHIVPRILLPRDAASLGRFVTSFDNPLRNYHDPSIPTAEQTLSHKGFAGERLSASGSSFHSRLSSLLSGHYFNQRKEKISVSADNIKRYMLDNVDGWFAQVMSLDETQRWVQRSIYRGDKDVYVIVGFCTLTNANICQVASAGSGAGGSVEVPASQALAAAGITVPPEAEINPEVAADRDSMAQAQFHFGVDSEEVCAIEYCKLRHSWLQGRDLHESRLSRRTYYWPSKSALRSESEVKDLFLVELAGVEPVDGAWEEVEEVEEDGERFLVCLATSVDNY